MPFYKVAKTSMSGTYIAGVYEAKNAAGATSKARKEHGPEWTYYKWGGELTREEMLKELDEDNRTRD